MLKQQQKTNQKLAMNVSLTMLRSLHVLALPAQELFSYVRSEMVNNPLVALETDAFLENDMSQFFEQNGIGGSTFQELTPSAPFEHDESWWFDPKELPETKETLVEHLKGQVREQLHVSPAQTLLVDFLIDSLNQQGFLLESDEELAELTGVGLIDIKAAVKLLQSLQPTGVGSRDYKESLLAQLSSSDLLEQAIIRSHWEDFAQSRFEEMARSLGSTIAEIRKACQKILQLNPIPSNGFRMDQPMNYIVPEAIVTVSNETIEISFFHQFIPKITIVSDYEEKMNRICAKDQQFVREQINQAHQLQSALTKRAQTLEEIIYHIVRFQKQYFLRKTDCLAPLKQKDIASKLHMHESTISRAIRGKYIFSPYGYQQLSDLFVNTYPMDQGALSTSDLFSQMKRLLEGEDPDKPLSDAEMAEKLKEENIRVARRTIAKYRSLMGLPNASDRKKAYKIQKIREG